VDKNVNTRVLLSNGSRRGGRGSQQITAPPLATLLLRAHACLIRSRIGKKTLAEPSVSFSGALVLTSQQTAGQSIPQCLSGFRTDGEVK
jgi:hypothetical protein